MLPWGKLNRSHAVTLEPCAMLALETISTTSAVLSAARALFAVTCATSVTCPRGPMIAIVYCVAIALPRRSVWRRWRWRC